MRGQKHLIKCRCVLPHLKGRDNPPQHQFMVFSKIDDNDNVIVKYSQCNNCGLIHKVTDICRSEIMSGKEEMKSILSIEDIKTSLPKNLVDILERNDVDISSWENAQFIIENKQWGNFVVLAKEEEDGVINGKYVRIMSETFFKIESFQNQAILQP